MEFGDKASALWATTEEQRPTSGLAWKAHKGQRIMTRLILQQGAAGLFADPGCGKTSSILMAIKLLKLKAGVRRTLVLAPIRVRDNVWNAERLKWKEFHDLTMTIVRADDKEKTIREKSDVFVTSFSLIEWLATKLGFYSVQRASGALEMHYDLNRAEIPPFDMLVVDESTALKNHSTQRFKLMRQLAPLFRRRVIATGTPAPNGLINLFGQIFVLDLGNALGPYMSHYKQRFFTEDKFKHEVKLQKGAEQKIYKAIAPLVVRLDAADYVDMPERVETTIAVELPPKARTLYDKLEDEFFVELGELEKAGGTLTVVNAAALTAKLRQLANGGVYDDEHEAREVHTAKIDAIVELVDELQGNPTLIFYEFKHDLARLQKAFPHAPVIGGGISTKEVSSAIERWNNKELPVMLCHPASAAHGLNLADGGFHIIFASLSFDLEQHEQAICRVQRQGQKSKRVFVHTICARGTIDSVMLDRLAGKDKVQKSLLNALRDYARKKRVK